MRQLLQYEGRKLSKSKSFWLCGGALVVATILKLISMEIFYFMDQQVRSSAPGGFSIASIKPDFFTGQTFLVNSLAEFVPIVLSIFIPLFVCLDFSQKTIRNVIAKGNSRRIIFFSKFIVCMLVALVFSLTSVLGTAALGSLFWGFGGTFILQILLVLAIQFLLVFSMASWYLMLAILIRNPGITIAASLLGFSVIRYAVSIFDAIFSVPNLRTNLAALQLPTLLAAISVVNPSNDQIISAAVCGTICIVVFNGISFYTFSKRDA